LLEGDEEGWVEGDGVGPEQETQLLSSKAQ
jgi:hypothetical protein